MDSEVVVVSIFMDSLLNTVRSVYMYIFDFMSTEEGPFTVFSPVDEAFDAVNISDAMLLGMKEFYLTKTDVWNSSCSICKQS